MKILLVAEQHFRNPSISDSLASGLECLGYTVTILTMDNLRPDTSIDKIQPSTLFTRHIHNGREVYSTRSFGNNSLLRILDHLLFYTLGTFIIISINKKWDRIITLQTGFLTLAIPSILSSTILRGRKPLLWCQDLWPDAVLAYTHNWLARMMAVAASFVIYRFTDEIFVSSPAFIKPIKRFTKKTIEWIPNWPLQRYASNPIGPHGSHVEFLFAGNLGSFQGLEKVIMAFKNAADLSKITLKLTIIGTGSEYENLATLCNDDPRITLSNVWLDDVQLKSLYDNANILILSLRSNSMVGNTIPSKFQTYLTTGKPIFCIAGSELNGLIDDNHVGITADPENMQSIIDGFLRCAVLSKDTKQTYLSNAESLLNSTFDKKILIDKIEQVILR